MRTIASWSPVTKSFCLLGLDDDEMPLIYTQDQLAVLDAGQVLPCGPGFHFDRDLFAQVFGTLFCQYRLRITDAPVTTLPLNPATPRAAGLQQVGSTTWLVMELTSHEEQEAIRTFCRAPITGVSAGVAA